MKSKYEKMEDYDIFVMKQKGILKLACCDCGSVHTHAFLIKGNYHYKLAVKQHGKEILKSNEIGICIVKEERSTAQLRRHKYGHLQRPIKKDKYKLVKR